MLIRVQIKKIFLHTRPPRKKRKKSKLLSFLAGHYCEFFFPPLSENEKKKEKKKGERKQQFFCFPKLNLMPNFQISETRKRSDTPQPHKKSVRLPFFFLPKNTTKN